MGMPELNFGTAATYLRFVTAPPSRMRREYTIAAGQPPAVASIIFGQNDEMRRGCSLFRSDVASSLRGTTGT